MFAAGLDFLRDLSENNARDWFTAHKARYERDLRGPALALAERFGPRLAALSPAFGGATVSRIQRDTRFSADKSPYKDWIGIHFVHEAGREAPGFHLRLAASSGAGVGVWMLEPPALAAVRARVAEPGWRPVRAALDAGGFSFIGESLKKVPRGFPADHPHAEDLRRKTFGAGRDVDPTADRFEDQLEAAFREGFPLVRFLCDALGLPV